MTWGQLFISAWMIYIACGLLAALYGIWETRRGVSNLLTGQLVLYRLNMEMLEHISPEAYAKIRAGIAAEAFARGLVNLNPENKENQ